MLKRLPEGIIDLNKMYSGSDGEEMSLACSEVQWEELKENEGHISSSAALRLLQMDEPLFTLTLST